MYVYMINYKTKSVNHR